MKTLATAIFLLLCLNSAYAQKSVDEISLNKVDSLKTVRVDTILCYHSYCGECDIKDKPGRTSCAAEGGYTLIDNFILYQQKGRTYELDFDCNNITRKRQLYSCKSISYFISIISTLKARDKAIAAIYKRGHFLGPVVSDGGFEDATLYFHQKSLHVSMSYSEKTDLYYIYKKYFWTDRQIKLMKLISDDTVVERK